MKILYAVQATGNGHIARAKELLPYLEQYGTVDVFLSGSNSNLPVPLPVKYKSKGVSLFYGNRGGLDYWKMLQELSPLKIMAEARALPVEKYDMVINDFECITSLACKLKKVASVNFGHQASFLSSHTPRPAKKDPVGELILRNYAAATTYIGLHFEQYDDFIYSPIIKEQVLYANPTDQEHITVYLSHYSDAFIIPYLQQLPAVRFEVFSKQVTQKMQVGNICFLPINNEAFTRSMIHAAGVITGAGFETPAEALVLGKKLLCLPIRGQYEQLCNAAALKNFGVPVLSSIGESFPDEIRSWLQAPAPKTLELVHSTDTIVSKVIETAMSIRRTTDHIDAYAFHPLALKYQ
jgi:uncharacterized protein (TIGR00661 family)